MRLHRFIGNFDTGKSTLKVHDGELLNQIKNVLRLEKGKEVILGDGNLNEARAKITETGKDFVGFEIVERWRNQNEPERNVVLYCAVLKKENFELVIQKATETGVKEIIPVITERTIKLNIRLDRLGKIIKEAAEQSGRGIVPVLHEPVNFRDAAEAAKTNIFNNFFDSSGESFTGPDGLSKEGQDLPAGRQVGVWIGPEGGWTDSELSSARESKFKIINLGKLTLRAETAAIIGTYLATR